MRLNQWLARATGMSRRAADDVIRQGSVTINTTLAELGSVVAPGDQITLDSTVLSLPETVYFAFNKPAGFICTRARQGNSKTIYDLLPPELHQLKSIGRLDKDSSGLLVLTNDGPLAQNLSHPSQQKTKVYELTLDHPLSPAHKSHIEAGVSLEDGLSQFSLSGAGKNWTAVLKEGRNRQIRRTFAALGYTVDKLHRTSFGKLKLDGLASGQFRGITAQEIL